MALCCCLLAMPVAAQQKKTLQHEVYDSWRDIENKSVSGNGQWALYQYQPNKGDATLEITRLADGQQFQVPHATNAAFTYSADFVIFRIKPHLDTLNNMRRRKEKDEDLPKDTLGIWSAASTSLEKIPGVKSFKMPEKAGEWLAYQLEKIPEPEVEPDTTATDSTAAEKPETKKEKEVSDDNGHHLVLRELATARQDTFKYITDFAFSESGSALVFTSTGDDSLFLPGVYRYDLAARQLQPMLRGKGTFKGLTQPKAGDQLAFLADLDTTEERVRYYGLYYWRTGQDSAKLLADTAQVAMPQNWLVNQHNAPYFSRSGERLFFYTSPTPLLPDTTLLDEEKVKVEVWSWQDQYLQTQQEVEKEQEKKRGYLAVYHLASDKMVQLANEQLVNISPADEGDAAHALGYTNLPYGRFISWEGFPPYHDVYVVDLQSGERRKVAEKMKGYPASSPKGKYLYWYSAKDTAWFTHNIALGQTRNLTANSGLQIWEELHDYPDDPSSYGTAGWTKNDEALLIYDRYDIWQFNPDGEGQPQRITQNGRENSLRYRYLKTDPEARSIASGEPLYLQVFNEKTKGEGYYRLNWHKQRSGAPEKLIEGDFLLGSFSKARESEAVIFTRETFQEFPDVIASTLDFKELDKISRANPQQQEYLWGTTELVSWMSLDGQPLEGILVKPENFDPNKKYPLIVNFYERSSQGLHRHRAPAAVRSTINYSFYASRGYVIFNPDVPYRPGYPGQSCYNAVMPGITSLVNQGFIDEQNIAAQGHSWGGYQIAYLVTRTNLFKAAEAGAPVPNMISAYGGIRWWTGLTRQFQYEHSQSRIGGSPWQYPLRYLENSPIFFLDKIETPLLIMHNDADGHVPWYQGIEMFVGLRRLGKPSWMLNYNDEPHWPLRYANMTDFTIRMQQFFDHYLKGAPAPEWMTDGIPAVEKGINMGYELTGQE